MDEKALCPSEVPGNRACGVAPEQPLGLHPSPRRERAQRANHVSGRIAHAGAERQRGVGVSDGH